VAINRIFDDAVDLQLDLFRTAASVELEVLDILRTLERELLGKLAGKTITEWSRTRTNQQLRETRILIQDYYARAADVSTEAMVGIANVTATATAATLVVTESQITRLSDDFLRTLAGDSIIQGAVQSEWWSRQSADTVFRFNGAVRQGIAAGETNQQIIRRVLQFMDVSRANSAALVQTSTATVANDARMAMFEANADIIKRYRAVATLDTNTCTRCAPLDGLEWEKDGTPIGHNFPMPRYPLHFNCRCQLIPQVFDSPPSGQRASADGPISARTTFTEWLERQPAEKVEDVLGKGRADLFRSGKITLAQLTNGAGRPLTLDQLRTKYGA
jgi:SPP1 gp7 family putative phage head morphogenesis protein